MAEYAISTTVPATFGATLDRVRRALAEQGFGILTEIDFAATMKAKQDVDMPPMVILGACNPRLAHRALTAEDSIGVLLPCNVVVRAVDDQRTLVKAVDPEMMTTATGNPDLAPIAAEARARLAAALRDVATTAERSV
jgi:uncharacterized protein (DUF302 family)